MFSNNEYGDDIAYLCASEFPELYCGYGPTLSDALFAAARRVKQIEPDCIGFDVTVNPPYSYDSDGNWTVNVYAIRSEGEG